MTNQRVAAVRRSDIESASKTWKATTDEAVQVAPRSSKKRSRNDDAVTDPGTRRSTAQDHHRRPVDNITNVGGVHPAEPRYSYPHFYLRSKFTSISQLNMLHWPRNSSSTVVWHTRRSLPARQILKVTENQLLYITAGYDA